MVVCVVMCVKLAVRYYYSHTNQIYDTAMISTNILLYVNVNASKFKILFVTYIHAARK